MCTTLRHTSVFTYSHANTPLGQSERAYYLSYFITCFISGGENSNPVSGQGIFPQVTVLTATVPPYLLKRLKEIYHTDPNDQLIKFSVCDQLMPGSFPARLLLGGENPWERGCQLRWRAKVF